MQRFSALVQFQLPSLLVMQAYRTQLCKVLPSLELCYITLFFPFSCLFSFVFLVCFFLLRLFFIIIVCFVRILSLFGSPFASSPSSCSSVTYAISFQYDAAKNKLHSGLKLNCKSCCLEQMWANRKKCTNVMFVPQGSTT